MPEIQQPSVFCVILNSNRRADTLGCLDSLRRNSYTDHRAIVLDNKSSDGSVQAIHSTFPEVEVIDLAENLGYAGNNNVGIQAALAAGADWVLILNEDTVLAPDCLAALVEAGERDPEVGIVGPMIYHFCEPEVIQSAGGKLGRCWQSSHLGVDEADRGQFGEPHRVDWVSGCAIMVRRAVIEQVGMIDPRYFYYYEETEWCLRAARVGWSIVNVPQARLWHKGVQPNHQPKPAVTYYATRNWLLTLSKHHAPLSMRILAWAQLLRTLTSWTVKPRWRGKRAHRDALWHGMADFVAHRWGQMPE